MSTELVNGIYLIKNTGSGKYLNVWGIDQVGNSRNVNQYDLSAELSQVFWVQKTTTGVLKLSSIIKDANGAYYSLNVNTNTFIENYVYSSRRRTRLHTVNPSRLGSDR